MSRNLVDEKYISHGGMVPLKWMSPEVWFKYYARLSMLGMYRTHSNYYNILATLNRQSITVNTLPPVMCGALVV